MQLRWLVAGTIVVALFCGCRSTSTGWSSAPRTAAADPDRWDRAICRLGIYPVELDSRALASARYDELRARQSGFTEQAAAARILSERDAFDARCAELLATSTAQTQ